MRIERAITDVCSVCCAGPGQPCLVGSSGKRATSPHKVAVKTRWVRLGALGDVLVVNDSPARQ